MSNNLLPNVYASGSYTCEAPFNNICDPEIYFTAEAVRTVSEMRAMNLNLQKLIFDPVSISEAEGNALLTECEKKNGAVITLTSRKKVKIYILSTKLLSFPQVDGVRYERLALIVDLGSCPPSLKDALDLAKVDISDYVETVVGVNNQVRVGISPTVGYVSGDQAKVFETTRRNKIKDVKNSVTELAEAKATIASQQAYIAELEDVITSGSTEP